MWTCLQEHRTGISKLRCVWFQRALTFPFSMLTARVFPLTWKGWTSCQNKYRNPHFPQGFFKTYGFYARPMLVSAFADGKKYEEDVHFYEKRQNVKQCSGCVLQQAVWRPCTRGSSRDPCRLLPGTRSDPRAESVRTCALFRFWASISKMCPEVSEMP